MTLATFLSSFLPSASCDAPQEEEEAVVVVNTNADEKAEEETEVVENEEREEEEEPQDPLDELREECKNSNGCAKFTHHFEHCKQKVEAGQGFKGEDCVEEMFHMMHCVDNCAAPKLFAKLR